MRLRHSRPQPYRGVFPARELRRPLACPADGQHDAFLPQVDVEEWQHFAGRPPTSRLKPQVAARSQLPRNRREVLHGASRALGVADETVPVLAEGQPGVERLHGLDERRLGGAGVHKVKHPLDRGEVGVDVDLGAHCQPGRGIGKGDRLDEGIRVGGARATAALPVAEQLGGLRAVAHEGEGELSCLSLGGECLRPLLGSFLFTNGLGHRALLRSCSCPRFA